MRYLFIFLLAITSIQCRSQDCANLSKNFTSYSEAIKEVKKHTFKVKEKADVLGSTWIAAASYYSCDGITGYFIYSTKKGKEYIYNDVPIEVWEGFKKAPSKGSYYDYNIKDKYQFNL